MELRVLTTAHTPNSGCSILVKRNVLNQGKYGTWKSYNVRCLASERRGFGSEPVKKEKSNNSMKNLKERKQFGPEPNRPLSGEPKTKGRQAPELSGSIDKNSSNAVFDRQFMEKLEAVRRSALEQKKADENKFTQAIDYDAPIKSDKTTIGLGTKVGVGIAVVAFGLVFALGDFLPLGSVAPNEGTTVIGKQLTEDEKSTLQARLQQYEATLGTSPEDPIALEGAAVTLVELGEYERASSLLKKLIKESPSNTEAHRLLGDVKFELKDYEGSALAYKIALAASDSVDFEVLRELTNSLLAAKKPDEAVQVLLSTREKLRSGNVSGPNVLSDANADVDKKKQNVDPIQVELLLGKAYSDWGHVSDAVSVYDQLISSYPNDFRGYLAKGIILKENGKVGDAERMFIQARFFAPDRAKALVDRYSGQ